MPSSYTSSYQLNQWEKSDKVLMEDFNADNAKIDGALFALAKADTAEAAARKSLETAMNKKGNCQIQYSTYTGDGADTKSVTFSRVPLMFFIMGRNIFLRAVRGVSHVMSSHSASSGQAIPVTWNGKTVSWSATPEYACTTYGESYFVIAFFDLSE